MSELIWVMKQENNTLEDLVTYIKSYAVEYLENNNIDISIAIPDSFDGLMINGSARRNLFLSVKESLHNIVKHAQASQVNIWISVDDQLKICIRDNGSGIIQNTSQKTVGGNGLRNMRSRIESMGGTIQIATDGGTQISFKIPLTAIG
ncbi:MAG TPA: ATP-binding protein [Flavobacterium sp.]|nr:ATP-binding protein [Flavobacterium sp.]